MAMQELLQELFLNEVLKLRWRKGWREVFDPTSPTTILQGPHMCGPFIFGERHGDLVARFRQTEDRAFPAWVFHLLEIFGHTG